MDCPHIIADENGFCIDCGEEAPGAVSLSPAERHHIVTIPQGSPMFWIPIPAKADLPAINNLAENTVLDYADEIERTRDKDNPAIPQLRWSGTFLYRPDWSEIWNKTVARSYMGAIALGYRQGMGIWKEFLEEIVRQGCSPITSSPRAS